MSLNCVGVHGESRDFLLHSDFAFAAEIGIRLKSCHMRTNIPNRVRLLVARTANASGAVSTTVEDRYISVYQVRQVELILRSHDWLEPSPRCASSSFPSHSCVKQLKP